MIRPAAVVSILTALAVYTAVQWRRFTRLGGIA